MLESQKGLCAICKKPETEVHPQSKKILNLSVDHCHKTGKVRGLLCRFCNRGIGLLREDINILISAQKYLGG